MKAVALSLVTVLTLLAMTADAEAGRRRRMNCCPCPTNTPAIVNTAQPPVGAGVFVSPSGKEYRFHVADETPTDEGRGPASYGTPNRDDSIEPIMRSSFVPAGPDDFVGGHRGNVKSSVVKNVPTETFASLTDFRNTLKPDQEVRPMITDPNSRIDLEQRNVQIKAFVYLAYVKPDNDVHLILGNTNQDRDGTTMLLAEVSALPKNSDRETLQRVRDQVKTYFRGHLSNAMMTFDDPIPVVVSGSLFFDTKPASGRVGAGAFKPNTTWEIHPVTAVQFLDEAK